MRLASVNPCTMRGPGDDLPPDYFEPIEEEDGDDEDENECWDETEEQEEN